MEKTYLNHFVECRICGKRFKSLTLHIINYHKMSTKEYKEKFPGTSLMSEDTKLKILAYRSDSETKKKLADSMKRRQRESIDGLGWANPNVRKKIFENNPDRGKKVAESLRKYWSEHKEERMPHLRKLHEKLRQEGKFDKIMATARAARKFNVNKEIKRQELIKDNNIIDVEEVFKKNNVFYIKNFSLENISYPYFLVKYNLLIAIEGLNDNVTNMEVKAKEEQYDFIYLKNDNLKHESDLLKTIYIKNEN